MSYIRDMTHVGHITRIAAEEDASGAQIRHATYVCDALTACYICV
jgi:hypothetical protein